MRAEHLKRWLAAARKAEKDAATAGAETTEDKETTAFKTSTDPTEAANWEMVVDLIHTAFREGKLAEEATWKAVVLIPKGDNDYRGIGLVEVMWKVVAEILNRRLTASTPFHDFLLGFRAGRGTGTTTLKAKLFQQLAALREEVMYVIFLELHKAYGALDRSRCLDILEGYGVGPRSRRLLQTYWRCLTMVSRAGGYYGTVFQGARGLKQGDPLSPTIFNVVVDAVVRHWGTGVISGAEEWGERVKEGRHQYSLFYVDNGMVASSDPCWLQGAFNTLVGLRNNAGKTVGMVCRPCQAVGNLSEVAYGRRITGEVPTYRERLKGRVSCRECGEMMVAGSLASHLMTQHGRVA